MHSNSLRNRIGIDRCRFELTFKEKQNDSARIVSIKSRYGHEFGDIQVERGKWVISLCLPKYFSEHNAVPFKMEKEKCFGEITDCILDTIRKNFDGPFKTSLTTIEMNITEVYQGCNYESFFLLLSHSMLDETKQNARYEISDRRVRLKSITTGIKTRMIKGRFFVKAYDKKRQLLAEYGATIDYSPIRIEFVFSRIALQKYFGTQRSVNVIFSKAGLNTLIDAYVETMNEVIRCYIDPYLAEIQEAMFTYMRKNRSIRDTFCEFKEVVYDIEQLREVLKVYYLEKGQNDSSRKQISELNKRFTIPKGTLHTLEHIKKSLRM